ncbi:MAG: Arsenic efflux pump protein [Labilithrix sp.]|nr:Arsenic efflux pump protein [Labilithrix sp.]
MPVWKGVLVFGVTYALVAGRRMRWLPIDRPAGALVGAVLAVVLGALTPAEAGAAIDKSTLTLLFAVMGMGAFFSIDGFLERATMRLVAVARTRRRLLGALVWGSGILSALVTNDAVCVLLAPLVVDIVDRWKLPRLPFLLALATGANTGSVATLVGNPQNMLCASLGGLDFATFLIHMVPVAILALAANHALLAWIYGADLDGDLAVVDAGGALFTPRSVLTLVVIAGTVIVYTAGGSLSFTALGGFVVLVLLHRVEAERVWGKIDWSILLFFGGLFIAVDALGRSGLVSSVFERFPLFDASLGRWAYARVAALFMIGSNIVTNVPFILIVRPEMSRLPDPVLGWELLAMTSTFAGNLTLLGSVANVIVAEKSQRIGGLGFGEYLRAGFPIATVTTIIGTAWLVGLRLLH